MSGPLSIATCSWDTLVAELGDPFAGRPPRRIPDRLLTHPATELARPTRARPPVPPATRPIPRAPGATSILRTTPREVS